MGESNGGVVSKLIEKAGEQGFSFIVMGFVCWVMYSMIVQNNADMREEINQLKDDYKECISYNRQMLEDKILTDRNK
jgi:hypothetical protein